MHVLQQEKTRPPSVTVVQTGDRMQRWHILPEANQLQLLLQARPPHAIYPVAAPLLQQTTDYFQVINSVRVRLAAPAPTAECEERVS